jgi:pyruvate formate lyase activating enzyme
MTKCKFCNKENSLISQTLKICRECILTKDWEKVKPYLLSIHSEIRKEEDLPSSAPRCENSQKKLACNLCINECRITIDNKSYCGLRDLKRAESGDLPLPSKTQGYIHGYLDSNPTNCCNSWFCPAGTSNGYPKYSIKNGPEYNTYSYAAFIYGCSFNCLFCQNPNHKNINKRHLQDAESIVKEIIENKKITCICYFGGTPETQLPFTTTLSELILKKIYRERIMRFCWEWNGTGNQKLVEKCMKIALKTGGNIKFDLKAYNERMSYALSGQSNERTLENFKFLGENYFGTRKNLPEISGCTLLVPGYTTSEEVKKIVKLIASINRKIPYSLLIFHPDYCMYELPYTSKKQAYKCLEIAQKYLENVHLGNQFLLGLSS